MKKPLTVYNYLTTGNAMITLTDSDTGEVFTYNVLKSKGRSWSVFLLVQPACYRYIGVLEKGLFHVRNGFDEEFPAFDLFNRLIISLVRRWEIPDSITVEHAGEHSRPAYLIPTTCTDVIGSACYIVN